MKHSPIPRPLDAAPDFRRGLVALALLAASAAALADPSYRNSLEVREAMQRLKTEDPAEIRLRWGDMTDLVSRRRLVGKAPANVAPEASFWREASWLVSGAVMVYSVGHCKKPNDCQKVDWLVQYNPQQNQLDYYTANDLPWMKGQLQHDGAIKVSRAFFSFETVRFDRKASEVVITDWTPFEVRFRPASVREIVQASGGKAGDLAQAEAEEKAEAQARAKEREEKEAAAKAAEQAREAKAREELAAARAVLEPKRRALASRLPVLAVGDSKNLTMKASAGRAATSELFFLQHDRPSAISVEASSPTAPMLVAVYEVEKPAPVATAFAAGGDAARVSVNAAGEKLYVIAVRSLDGKAGRYSLKVASVQ